MKTIEPEMTVGDIVRAAPARSRIFEELGIDYCCGGERPLAEACRAKGVDPATVTAMLRALDDRPDPEMVDPEAMSLPELCDHIVRVHHAYLREELPRLDLMTRQVVAVHGLQKPGVIEIRRVFEIFSQGMAAHAIEEENSVFPMISRLATTEEGRTSTPSALKVALEKLEKEHAAAGAELKQFRELTHDYAPPEWACNTVRALYDRLERLEKDTHQHVHKENNVLFPRALAAV
ncbi:MAG: iron-sulfur cluster repair di-iron protein [Opitutaceae bacterium]